MRKHRFFIPIPLAVKQELTLSRDLSHHISKVLRMQNADQIYLFNDSGNEYTGYITDTQRNSVNIRIISVTQPVVESPLKIHLGQVLGKGEKMDLVIQKATELGVSSITPLYSEHSVVKQVAERSENKLEHWQRIAVAASCQSWRTIVPTMHAPQKLSTWITANNKQYKFILHPSANSISIQSLTVSNEVALLIGPEGGFSSAEVQLAIDHGFDDINLGPRILRTETAGVVAVAIMQALFGDL